MSLDRKRNPKCGSRFALHFSTSQTNSTSVSSHILCVGKLPAWQASYHPVVKLPPRLCCLVLYLIVRAFSFVAKLDRWDGFDLSMLLRLHCNLRRMLSSHSKKVTDIKRIRDAHSSRVGDSCRSQKSVWLDQLLHTKCSSLPFIACGPLAKKTPRAFLRFA